MLWPFEGVISPRQTLPTSLQRQALATTYNRNAIGIRALWLPRYLCHLSQVLGVVISLRRMATSSNGARPGRESWIKWVFFSVYSVELMRQLLFQVEISNFS